MPFEPPPDPRQARRIAVWRWVSFSIASALILVVVYLAYVGYQGSLVFGANSREGDCRTPASAFGWSYEAINYEIASDAGLDAYANRLDCAGTGQAAGTDLITGDGTRIAGWYVPVAGQRDPAAPTVVLAHDQGKSKSDMLAWAALLHDSYNLVIFDFRNNGQSSGEITTLGVREVQDLRAIIDWVEQAKQPSSIAVLGVSMGGTAAINEAEADDRVVAVILDSMHATLANALQARLEADGFPLALPGAWSILLGGQLRTGEDMSAVDPVQAIGRYGERPVLIVAAGQDEAVGANDEDDLATAARDDGATVELETCAAARHGTSAATCPTEYQGWVLAFLERFLPHAP